MRRLPRVCGVVLALLLFGLPGSTSAQAPDSVRSGEPRYTMALRGVPLETALQQFVARTNADLAYSTKLVEGRTAYCRSRTATVETLLSCILSGTGVDYLRTASGSYLLVASPKAPPPVGRIAGTVVDAATGEPLPNANVLLADAGTGTATNQAGQFTVAPVLAGKHRLVVTYVGYRTAVDSVQVPPEGRDTIRVLLSRRVLDTDPVLIDGLQQRLPSANLGQNDLGASGLTRLSGRGTPDVLRSASRQIGVSLNRPLAEISVQGGGSGEDVMLLDGVPVRKPLSLGGLLSAFSPQALDRLTVHKAGFGAAHGSYTAGVLAATHDLSRSSARYAAATADPISVNGRADVEWRSGASRSGQAMVAGRTNVWDAYRAPSLHHLLDTRTAVDRPLTPSWTGVPIQTDGALRQNRTAHVRFSDVHAALRQEITPFQQLSVSGYRGSTELGTDVASVLPAGDTNRLLLAQDRYDWTNTALQGRYEWLAGSRVTGSMQLWGSWHETSTFFGIRRDSLRTEDVPRPPAADERIIDSHSIEGNRIAEGGARAKVDVSVSPTLHVRAGLAPQYLEGRFQVFNPFLDTLQHASSDWQVGSYVEAEVSPGFNVTATAGTRLTYVQARSTVYAEPRLSLRYDRSETPLGGLAVRLAGGLYRQYVMQSEISGAGPTSVVPSVQFWLPIDRSVAPARAYHASGAVLLTPTDTWSARLETYYKWQPNTLQVDYAGLVQPPVPSPPGPSLDRTFDTQSDFVAAGTGRAYGAALHLQRDGERVSGSVSAEWTRAERRYPGRFDDRFVPAPWDQPLRLAATLDVTLTEGLHALAHWNGNWGRSWALRRPYYDYLAPLDADRFDGYDLSRPGQQTLDPFSRLDLGLKGETSVGGVTLRAQFQVVNVLGRHNAFDQSLDSTGPRPTPVARTLPGRRAFVLIGLRY
ncbi:MAG TPA: TonB-dependent receptor [Salinibacter sp.]|nr:TonB-dependent receptor [Salinibacter sp.]